MKTTVTDHPATRHDIWRALHAATDQHDMPVPRYVKDTECIIASQPMLIIRLDYIDEAMAWAQYIGIEPSGATSERPGLIGINYFGDWPDMGWQVLLVADEVVEPTVEQVAAALVVAT